MKSMKLKTKLIISFGAIIFFAVLIAVVGLFSVNTITENFRHVAGIDQPAIISLGNIKTSQEAIKGYERTLNIIKLNNDTKFSSSQIIKMEMHFKLLDSNFKILEKLNLDSEEKKLLEETLLEYNVWKENEIQTIGLFKKKIIILENYGKPDVPVIDALNVQNLEQLQNNIAAFDNSNKLLIKLIEKIHKNTTVDQETSFSNTYLYKLLMTIQAIVFVVLSFGFMIYLIMNIMKQLGGDPLMCMEIANKVSMGDLSMKIIIREKDNSSLLASMKKMSDNIKNLVLDAHELSKAEIDGNLNTRADTTRHQGEYSAIMDGVNRTLDAVINPLKMSADYIALISNGRIPQPITDEYKGDFNIIKNNLNTCIRTLNTMDSETDGLINAAKAGILDKRGDASELHGVYKKILKGFNEALDAIVFPLKVAADYIDRISKGDVPPRINEIYNGDFNEIKNNLNTCIDAINLLVSDSAALVNAATKGELNVRASIEQHQGDFRRIIDGLNRTFDAVVEPLNDANEVLSIMATGDLSVRMEKDYAGDLQKLKMDVNSLGDSLINLIIQVTDTVHVTASSSHQISATADSLAASTQQQSAQADEVATAVEEMSRTIAENASNAGRTSTEAEKNGGIARDGGEVVRQTVIKMREIANTVKISADNIQKLGESSKEIGEIISVINDIADQTNLLALNAAIEAARAGEQGRGFAVVADEVRKLAERTTDATKKIAKMIKAIQKETEEAVKMMNKGTAEVQSGIEFADRAGISLNEIVSSSQEVMYMISQIAAACEEQSATSEEISKNVVSISKVSADSARRVEDVAHTAEDLTKMTEHLKELMEQFKIEGDDKYHAISSGHGMRQITGGSRQLRGRY
ncbi:MAG: methyl-accepting chemotaxis sensory transducer with Pas/Pac sensor [Ignavibacteria bacterium]|nr:methyl-accepting chemotaxis sensory transducer with Pas/Pac sensor [Ignavibacteria bacterium]